MASGGDKVGVGFKIEAEEAKKELSDLDKRFDAMDRRELSWKGDKLARGVHDTVEEMKRLEKAAEDAQKALTEKEGKARGFFAQAIGGEEMPERLNKIREGFKLSGDASLSFTSRLQAGVGALGLAGGAAGLLGGKLLGLVEGYMQLSQEAQQHVQTITMMGDAYGTMAAAVQGVADAQELFAHRETVADAAIQASAQQLGQLEGAAQQFAAVHGGTATAAVNRFVGALQQGNSGALARFGVHLSDAQLHAQGATAATERFAAALAQMQQHAAQPIPQDGIAATLSRTWGGLKNALLDVVGPSDEARARMQSMAEAERDAEADARRLTEAEQVRLRQQEHAYHESQNLLQAYSTLRGALGENLSAQELATVALQKHADALQNEISLGQQAQLAWEASAHSQQFLLGDIERGRVATEELTRVQGLLAASANTAAAAQRNLSLVMREGESAQDATTRVMQAALQSLPGRHQQAQMHNEVRRGLLAAAQRSHGAFSARDIDALGFGAQGGGGGGGDTTHVRQQIDELRVSAEKFGIAMDAFGRGRREGLPQYLQRLQHDLVPAIEGAQHYADAVLQIAQAEEARAEAVRVAEIEQRVAEAERVKARYQTQADLVNGLNGRLRGGEDTRNATARGEEMYRTLDEATARTEALARVRHLAELAGQAEYQGNTQLVESYRTQIEALGQVVQSHDELNAARAQSNDFGAQFSQAFASHAEVTQTAAESMSATFSGAFGTMTGALRSHVAAVIEGKESVGDALRGVLHETLLNLATESVVQSLFNTAKGIAALAMEDYPGAGKFFASAAMFAAVGVASGIGARATAPPSTAAAAGGGFVGGPRGSSGVDTSAPGRGKGGSTVIINYNGAVMGTSADLADHHLMLVKDALQRGGTLD
jgi:hypothetical protein